MKPGTVVLIYPKLEPYSPKRINYMPLPILTLAAPLAAEGYDVNILDGRIVKNYREFLEKIDPPICFGISAMAGYQISDGLKIAGLVRKQFPTIPIVWGGKFPTILPDETLSDPHVDIVVRGQGEITFLKLLRTLTSGKPLTDINGLSYKQGEKIVHNPERPVQNPNTFPPLPYHLIDAAQYNCIANKSINYISSYGCPFRCAFCTTKYIYNRKWMGLEAGRVLDEIETVSKKYDVKVIDIQDDLFFANVNRAKTILKGFIKRKLEIKWITTIRFNQLVRFDEETFELIKKSGCEAIYASAESGVQKVLDYVEKDLKVEQIEEGVRYLSKFEIPTRTTFLLGTPVETVDDLKETLNFSLKMKEIYPKLDIYFSFYMPIPGTPLFDKALKEGTVNKPGTLKDWAGFIPVDQSQPWLFIPLHKIQKDKRIAHRIVSFYFWAAYFPKLQQEMQKKRLGILAKAVVNLSKFRFKKNFYYLPFEWQIFRLLFNMKQKFNRDKPWTKGIMKKKRK